MRHHGNTVLILLSFLDVAAIDLPPDFGDRSAAPTPATPTAAVLGILIGGAASAACLLVDFLLSLGVIGRLL